SRWCAHRRPAGRRAPGQSRYRVRAAWNGAGRSTDCVGWAWKTAAPRAGDGGYRSVRPGSRARRVATVGYAWFSAPREKRGEQPAAASSGHRDHAHHALDHLILVDAGGFRLEGENDAMAQHIEQHRLDVLGADEIPPGQPGIGPRAAVQCD